MGGIISLERENRIVISATIYTDLQSYASAKQAAQFWNNRKNDKYESKTIEYAIFVAVKKNIKPYVLNNDANTYIVNSKLVNKVVNGDTAAGAAVEHKHAYVHKDYSITKPGSLFREKSTTGAHEIGHLLGMNHARTGVMSPKQDSNRSNNVLQENINQMMNSEYGQKDLVTRIYELYKKIIR